MGCGWEQRDWWHWSGMMELGVSEGVGGAGRGQAESTQPGDRLDQGTGEWQLLSRIWGFKSYSYLLTLSPNPHCLPGSVSRMIFSLSFHLSMFIQHPWARLCIKWCEHNYEHTHWLLPPEEEKINNKLIKNELKHWLLIKVWWGKK